MTNGIWCPQCETKNSRMIVCYVEAGRYAAHCTTCGMTGPACATSQQALATWVKLFPPPIQTPPNRRVHVPIHFWPDGSFAVKASGSPDSQLFEVDMFKDSEFEPGSSILWITFDIPTVQEIPATVEPTEPHP